MSLTFIYQSVCLPTVIYMTYVVHKTKEIKDARARKEEVEGNARDKRKIELAFEKKFIKACKDEIILTDGHIAVETEQMEFVLQVKNHGRKSIKILSVSYFFKFTAAARLSVTL